MFTLRATDGGARAGTLELKSGVVETPFFMPVATFATGRGIGPRDYEEAGVQVSISNSFLLSLKPGADVIRKKGGLARFMGFSGATFTDSGGFQSSSEKMFVKASRRGVHLRSPFDGSTHVMTPKKVVELQQALGSDVAMVIDDMAPPDASKAEYEKALKNTHRWARECKESHADDKQLLFAIVQGGYDAELRKESAEHLSSLDFDGYAVGGCAIGEPKPDMYRAIEHSTPHLPEDKPRYLMGVGSPPDILKAISLGIDCFDSIFPTRNARHRMIFTRQGPYQLEKARYAHDSEPLEKGCGCWVCRKHSRAYIRHLTSLHEAEGMRLRQVHNVWFMMRLMEDVRQSIREGTFGEFKHFFLESWFQGKVPKIYK